MRTSLKYLMRSLEYSLQDNSTTQAQVPIVETYLNICNAHMYLTQYDKALEFSDSALARSQKIVDELIVILDSTQN